MRFSRPWRDIQRSADSALHSRLRGAKAGRPLMVVGKPPAARGEILLGTRRPTIVNGARPSLRLGAPARLAV